MDISRFGTLFILCLMTTVLAIAETPTPVSEALRTQSLPQGLVSLSDPGFYSPYFFLVDKNRRFLRVYQNEAGTPKLVMEVPSDLGRKSGPKTKENDFKTPVGIYFLQRKKTQPEIPFSLYGSMAFTTDYPNIFDKREEKTGSGIWLHSVPDTVPLTRGSRGCVVVRNEVIQNLEQYVKLGQTPLIIFDDLKELSKEEYDKQRADFVKFVETWRAAWQKEDVDTYMKFYDPTFKNSNMNYDQWYAHKKKLKGLYKSIEVNLSSPLIVWNANQVVIRFFQQYKSNLHEDFGEKTIHASYSPESGFKIIREDWSRRKMPAGWNVKGLRPEASLGGVAPANDQPARSMSTAN